MKLSIGMMVKNEEKHLKKCLQSLKPIMQAVSSELIIVDTGSEDSTVEIARKYTDKVYFHPWNGDFAAMRNITISYAKGEWFFVIDGDEVVENPKGLISFLNSSKSKRYNSGFFRIKNFLSENGEHNAAFLFIPRLFRRDKDFCFRGKIHEQPVFKGPTAEIKTTLLHYGYINTDKELMERKFLRNIALLKSEVEKDPESIYYWFQLAQSYSMHGDYPEALEAILKAYTLIKDKKLDIKKYMYVLAQLARNYLQNKKYAEAEDVCQEALKINDGYFDFYYYLGSVQALMRKNNEAIANLKSYLTKVKEFEKTGVRDLAMSYYSLGEVEKTYSNLAVLYNRQEEYEKALECLEKISSKHIFKDLSLNLFTNYLGACFKLKNYARIKDYYDRVVSPLQEKDVEESFFITLEKSLLESPPEDKTIICQLFAAGESKYALLQKVRLAIYEGRSVDDILGAKIRELDFNELPDNYGDVLYYFLKNNFPITSILQNVRERKINSLLNYIKNVYDDLSQLLFRYLEKQKAGGAAGPTLPELIINKTFSKHLLVLDKLPEEQYEYIFDRYIEYGDKYIRSIYNEDIVQNERIAVVKDDEDAFLLYMSLAEAHKDNDEVKYFRYLRKALKEYPLLKKGIEIKLKKVQESVENVEADAPSRSPQLSPQDSAASSGLESYKRQVKDNLEKLINAGQIQEAKEIIQQYETLVGGDAEIYSMKGIIGIIENNLEEAEKNLREGLKIDEQNFDLLYNLAYVYEQGQKFPEAYEYYSRARKLCTEPELTAELENKLQELQKYAAIPQAGLQIHGNIKSTKVTIIIPTYNQKKYLKEAIDSCLKQDYNNLEIIVGDDCSTDGTERMMKEYLKKHKKITYIRNKKNLGAGINSQYLLDNYVRSKYAMILNHDDYLIKEDYISTVVNFFEENHNLSFVWANCKIKNEFTGEYSYTNFKINPITKGIDYFLNYETPQYPHITGTLTTIFDFEKLKTTEFGYEKTKSRDVFLYLNLMLVGDVGFIDDCVAVYRIHNKSISFNMPKEYDLSTIQELEKLKEYILSKKIANDYEMEIWINNRVFSYIFWRFRTLWKMNEKKDALNLLIRISKNYPNVYEKILDSI